MEKITSAIASIEQILGKSCSRTEAINYLKNFPDAFTLFSSFRPEFQNNVLNFLCGQSGIDITLDKFFLHILNPETHRERLESLLSTFLKQKVTIKTILPRDGVQLAERGSLVIMDIIVQLTDGSLIDVEMQKVGYFFPGQRSDCYSADMIMRQYNRIRSEKKAAFSYKDLKPVHLFILMETSPEEFHANPNEYIHERQISYSSGISLPNLSHITYISLDTFHSVVQNIDTELDAWLTFFSCTDAEHILKLVQKYPQFLDYYKDIAIFRNNPKELIYMFSEALEILDRNTANYMIDEMSQELKTLKTDFDTTKEKLDSTKNELDSAKNQLDSTKNELDSAKNQLDSTKNELDSTKNQLDSTKNQLDSTKNQLDSTKNQLDSTKNELDSAKNELDSVKNELADKDNTIASKDLEIEALKAQLAQLQQNK